MTETDVPAALHRSALARIAWGGGVLAASRCLSVPRQVAWALALRHVAQGGATLHHPAGLVARWGWAADAAHSASMLVVAAVSPRWRTAALLNAVTAAAWARAGRTKMP